MFRPLLVATLVLAFAPTAHARGPRVEFRLSRVHGLVDFVEALADVPNRNPLLLRAFRGSRFDTPATREVLSRFKRLAPLLQRGGLFAGYPSGRPGGTTVAQIIQTQAAHSRTLAELQSRTLGLMPAGAHAELMRVLRHVEPIYERLLWRPNLAKLRRYQRRLLAIAQRARVDELFDQAAAFYRARWPRDKAFTVALFPIPGARGHTMAYSLISVESVGVLVDEKDLANRFGVIFHELCHSLWDAQSPDVQRELEGHFGKAKGPHARLAYQTLNEALATTLGNGWAYLRATSHEDAGSWYADPYIDGFAKALSPLVRARLRARKGIDGDFVARAVALYVERFPNAPRDWSNVLRQVSIFADGSSIGTGGVIKALRRHFKATSIYSNSPLTHPATLRNLRRATGAVVVVVGSDRLAELKAFAKHYPPAARHLARLERAKEGMVIGVDENKRPFVLLVVRPDAKRLLAAFAKLKATGHVPGRATSSSF